MALLEKLKKIKTPKFLKPILGELLFKREPEYGKPFKIPVERETIEEMEKREIIKPRPYLPEPKITYPTVTKTKQGYIVGDIGRTKLLPYKELTKTQERVLAEASKATGEELAYMGIGFAPISRIAKPVAKLVKEPIKKLVAKVEPIIPKKIPPKRMIEKVIMPKPPKIIRPEPVLLRERLRAEIRGAKAGIAQFKREQKFVKSITKDITKELGKPKARQRSTIAFVKKIGELNQTVISEVKRDIGLIKPIRQANLEELNKLLSGMKERLAFKIRRGFVPKPPAVVEKISKPMKISEDTYKAFREIKMIKEPKMEVIKKSLEKAIKGIDPFVGVISTRLRNINPEILLKARRVEWDIKLNTQKGLKKANTYLDKIKPRKVFLKEKGMTVGDYAEYDAALKNGDVFKITTLNKKYGLEKEYQVIRQELDDIYKRANDVGFDVGYKQGYFPRVVKDSEGLLGHFMKRDDWSAFDKAIKNKELAIGRYLEQEEKANLINNIIRGYKGGQITLSKTGAMEHRVIDFIDPKINKFYADSSEALVRYIKQINDAIEARKFFGKSRIVDKKLDQFNNLDDSIGAYIIDLMAKGKITVAQEKELASILRARFNPKGTHGIVGIYKNLSYIDVMGSPFNAITQIGDLGFSLYKGGWRALKELPRAALRKGIIKKEDLGIEKIAAEFDDAGKTAKAVNTIFRLTGLTKIDAIGKETLINSTISKFIAQAKKPTPKFTKELRKYFTEKEAIKVAEDLRRGDITDEVKYLAFNTLSDFQPISLLEVPEHYVKGGNWRVAYMLKTWSIKAIDVYRREAFQLMTKKETFAKGFKNLLYLTGTLMAAETTADEIKDIVLGRERISLKDRTVDNIAKLVFLSRYTLRQAEREGIGRALLEIPLPPTQIIDNVYRDLADIMKDSDESFRINNLRTIQDIPLGGKLYYWWFGKASEYKEKKEDKPMTPSEWRKSQEVGKTKIMTPSEWRKSL